MSFIFALVEHCAKLWMFFRYIHVCAKWHAFLVPVANNICKFHLRIERSLSSSDSFSPSKHKQTLTIRRGREKYMYRYIPDKVLQQCKLYPDDTVLHLSRLRISSIVTPFFLRSNTSQSTSLGTTQLSSSPTTSPVLNCA